MAWCHGSGPGAGDHCCHVNGEPCPHLMDNAATVAWINSQGWGATKRNAALTMALNITWLCRIALQVMADDQSTQNNRAKFENAWNNHPDYVAYPRPVWAQLEADNGWPAGSYQCSRWGPPTTERPLRQCCFADASDAASTAKAQAKGLSTQAVTVRQQGKG